MREIILNAARELVDSEGVEKVSIRKIAAKIEYSPAIIYHYFANKEEIVEKLIAEQYMEIVKALAVLQTADMPPKEKLKKSALSFVTLAVKMGDSYKSMMTNDSPQILAHTSVLQQGAATERPAINILCNALREFPGFAHCDDLDIELTAQVIWATAFGLSMRLIVEQVDEEQKARLIDRTAEFVLHALENQQLNNG
ncbi:MAG TPA: helix-turn-helix domain-containing protein [Oscillospiraceae bacterium]|nr:helix-turn-helix domain-containing protein [Oscillospiraceae bacterium]